MLKFRPSLAVRGAFAGLLALAFFPALANAEITAAADFPLSSVTKAVKADPHAKLLELYRLDVLAGQGGSKQKTSSAPAESVSR